MISSLARHSVLLNTNLQADLSAKKGKAQIAAIEGRRKRIFETREDGTYTREEFQERRDAIDTELAAAKAALSPSLPNDFDPTAALQNAAAFITAFGHEWKEFLPQLRSRFQRLVLPAGIPYERISGFGTAQLGLIYEQNRHFLAADSPDVPLAGLDWNLLVEELKSVQKLKEEYTLFVAA